MPVAEPRWLTRLAVEILHPDQLAEHGGLPGIRDEGALSPHSIGRTIGGCTTRRSNWPS